MKSTVSSGTAEGSTVKLEYSESGESPNPDGAPRRRRRPHQKRREASARTSAAEPSFASFTTAVAPMSPKSAMPRAPAAPPIDPAVQSLCAAWFTPNVKLVSWDFDNTLLTIHAYKLQGLREVDLTDVIKHLKARMYDQSGPMPKRPASQLYKGWIREAGGDVCGEVAVSRAGEGAGRYDESAPTM